MNNIYVLSDPDSSRSDKYKIGITSRTKSKLKNDYRRSRPEVKIYLFESCKNNKLIESNILNKFNDKRIKHESNQLSEWLNIDLNTLLTEVRKELQLQSSQIIPVKKEVSSHYKVEDFIQEYCVLNVNHSTSCRVLYDKYILVNNQNKLNYLNFCRSLSNKLMEHHGFNKQQNKYKLNGLIFYRGISIKGYEGPNGINYYYDVYTKCVNVVNGLFKWFK